MGDIYISSHILGFLDFLYQLLFDQVREFFFNLSTQCNPLHLDGVGGEAD